MNQLAALDLRTARRNSGLTQADIAHLLQCSEATIAKLESGRRLPNIAELCALSVIYGRSFESLFANILADIQVELSGRLASIPQTSSVVRLRHNRAHTLDALTRRLAAQHADR